MKMKAIKNNVYIIRLCCKAAPLWFIMQIVFSIAEYGVSTFISLFFMRYIVEALQEGRAYGEVFWYIAGLFGIKFLLGAVQAWISDMLEPGVNVKISALFMEMLYKQAVSVDLSCYEDPKFYDTYTKANGQIVSYAWKVLSTLLQLIGMLVSGIITIAAIAALEPLVLLIIIVPMMIEQLLAKKYTEYKYNRDQDTIGDRRQMGYANRVVYRQEYAKELRLTEIFTPILHGFDCAAAHMKETCREYGIKIGIVRFCRTIVSELFVYFVVQGVIVYQYLVNSAYALGGLVTLLNAAGEFSNLAKKFVNIGNSIYECGIFVENFRIFMNYEAKISENRNGEIPNPEQMDICFKGVGFSYEGSDRPILKDINMTMKKGQKIAIVGHNGAGKSTFVKLLMRLYDSTEGSIEMGGIDIRNYQLGRYRDLFGTIFQDFKIYAASIADNVLMHGNADAQDRKRAEEALRESGILQKVNHLKNGMDSQLTREFDKEGVILSGGEFQKLAISRVFAKKCEICVLDEPSSALDPLSEYMVFENMLRACEGKTVVFISHRLASAVLADTIYLFENGRIVESGSHEVLMEQKGKYAEMFQMQAKRYSGGIHK